MRYASALLFHSQQKLLIILWMNSKPKANLAMSRIPVAACDFWRTGDKTLFQMPASLWHLGTCDPFHIISLNGRNYTGTQMVIEVSWTKQHEVRITGSLVMSILSRDTCLPPLPFDLMRSYSPCIIILPRILFKPGLAALAHTTFVDPFRGLLQKTSE